MTTVLARLSLAALAVGAACAGPAAAQTFPARTVTVIVPFAPGGTDIVARLLNDKFAERLGQSFIIENKPGARSQIGVDHVAKSAPDGHTLLLTAGTSHLKLSGAGKTATWEANSTLAPIGQVAISPLFLTAAPNKPYKNVAELIRWSKANPGKLNFASTGVATAGHMSFELLALETGMKAELVVYKGSSAMSAAMMTGEADVGVDAATAIPFVRSGKILGLAVMQPKRSALAPDIPSIAEAAGVQNFDTPIWYGLFAPGGTPAAIVNKLNAELNAIVRLPDIVARYQKDLALDTPPPQTPAQFDNLIRTEAARWTKALRETSINYQP